MKRTAGAFLLLAGLGGCMQTDRARMSSMYSHASSNQAEAKYQGPHGEPISPNSVARGGMPSGLVNANYVTGNAPKAGTDLVQAGFLNNCNTCGVGSGAGIGSGIGSRLHGFGSIFGGVKGGGDPSPAVTDKIPEYRKYGGTLTVPAMGPSGAVAAIGALPAYGPQIPVNMRTSVRFVGPEEMLGYKITWFGPNGWNDAPLIAPARYNFLQGGVYRLKISSVPNHLDKVYYPTLEVLPGSPKTLTYLAHSSVPITFTDEDFAQVNSGNFLVKVVYLPDPHNQDLATIVGPNELVSTRLEPGLDPIVEAQKRGTILLIVRMGNIDLQAPNTPALDAPNPYMIRPPVVMPVPGPKEKEKIAPPKVVVPPKSSDKKPKNLPPTID